MNIAILEPSWRNTGHPRVWLRFHAQALLAAGHEVTVFSPCGDNEVGSVPPPGCARVKVPDILDVFQHRASVPVHSLRIRAALSLYLDLIRAHAKQAGRRFDLLIFNYMDPLVADFSACSSGPLNEAGIPWCGFWDWPLRPGQKKARWPLGLVQRPWRLFSSRMCRGVFHKAENYGEFISDLTEGHAVAVPDFCLDTSVHAGSALGNKISEFANGRPIVLLAGMVEPRKGIGAFLDVATYSRSRWPAAFVVVGKVLYDRLSPEQRDLLSNSVNDPNGNLLVCDERVDDEGIFNDVISRASQLFLLYRDFAYSSGMQSKAAYFNKPMLATAGSLMGDRTQSFGIGLTTNADASAQELMAACQQLADPARTQSWNAGCDRFNDAHSFSRFCDVMRVAVERFAQDRAR